MTTDAELLKHYATQKSEAAFAKLVQRHLALVYSTALRQLNGDTHLAQDVAQTVFMTLARKAASLTGHATLVGWLYLSTHHAAAQVVRSNRRRHTREEEAHAMHELFASTAAATDWERVRPVLDDALRDLADADREAVLLRFFEQRPFAEIGAALNVTDDAARMRVDRALEKLRALLARRGITSSGAVLATALANQAMVAAPAGLANTITNAVLATAAGSFMSTTTIILSAVAALAIGSTIYQTNQVRHAEAAMAATAGERDRARAQIRELQQRAAEADGRLTVAEQQNAALQRDLASARSVKAAPTPAVTSTAPRYTFRALPAPADPAEARRQAREMNIENRDTSYSALYRQLGFTPAQHEQFKSLMIDYMDRRDAQVKAALAAAMAQSPKPDRAALQQVFDATGEQAYDDWLATMRNNFGDATVQAFQHNGETVSGRAVTTELASALFYTDTPLTVSQADQLVEIIAANSRNAQGKVDLSVMNTDAILAQAQAVLSAPQLAALRRAEMQAQEKFAPSGATMPTGN
jgi:RNA polymerase sigma factor (sigma-70 family)